MLAEKAAALAAQIGDLENQRRRTEKAQLYKNRADLLSVPAQKLTPLARVRVLFRERSVKVNLDEGLLYGLTAKVKQLAEAYDKDPESITAPDDQLRHTFWDPLKTFPTTVDGALKSAWSSHIDQVLPTGNPDLLTVLKRVPGFIAAVQEIQKGAQRAQELQATLPQSATAFEEVDQLAMKLKAAWDQLHGDEISPAIRQFLLDASQGKATLEQVTPEVKDWLTRHKLLKAFKVTL